MLKYNGDKSPYKRSSLSFCDNEGVDTSFLIGPLAIFLHIYIIMNFFKELRNVGQKISNVYDQSTSFRSEDKVTELIRTCSYPEEYFLLKYSVKHIV